MSTHNSNRVLKNKHPAVNRGGYVLEARGVRLETQKKSGAVNQASSRLHVSIYKSRTTPDHGVRRGF
jgi:hypothetical protein